MTVSYAGEGPPSTSPSPNLPHVRDSSTLQENLIDEHIDNLTIFSAASCALIGHFSRIEKYQLVDYHMIQYQILQNKIISNVRETVRRITKRIMGVKGNFVWEIGELAPKIDPLAMPQL
ncbi:hypothetical protein pdam_00023826 [Pocillopora damicornis]|uniref:Uncharacterized protein n=1 Tax=Pocillopora damicornis TaxID=46731 RepID=A0A3M6T5U4_POCDA|nr:hypothetical protein pdam_00023826 [Pocillopora damicornis]